MDLVELSRLVENLIRIGTIHAVDHKAVRCRVKTGNLVTQWLRWYTPRAGETRTWDPPTVGEQCVVLSPSGEAANAIVLYGLDSDLIPPPSHSPDDHVVEYPDGTILRYDHVAGIHEALYPDGAEIRYTHPDKHLEVKTPGPIDVSTEGPVRLISTGEITITTAASVSVQAAEMISLVAVENVQIISQGGSDTKISVSGNAEISSQGFIQFIAEQDILIRGNQGVIIQGPTGTIFV